MPRQKAPENQRLAIIIIIIIIKQSFITRLLINTYPENERSELGLMSRKNYNLKKYVFNWVLEVNNETLVFF